MGDDATVATELPETLPSTRYGVKGSVHEQWRERNGKQYGPYYCLMWRESGRLCKRYLKRDQAEAVRTACEGRQAAERERREQRGKIPLGTSRYEWDEQRRQINRMIRDAVGENMTPKQLRKVLYRR
jgi:hypothetical protein